MKNTLRGIKQLIRRKSGKRAQCPQNIVINNKTITDPKTIAEAFNEYFASVGSKLAQTIPHVNKSYIAYLTRPQCTSFYINPTTTKEIEEEISKLNTNKASGPYSIPVKLLKILTTVLSYPLSYLFKLLFSSGVVPDMIKIARVIPVYKAGCYTVMPNYRPISLLSLFHKLHEKLMYKRLIKFLEKNNILNKNQFGFRSNRSTIHKLYCL